MYNTCNAHGIDVSTSISPSTLRSQVFSDRGGGATNADIIEAMNWVIAHKQTYRGSAVMSMSLGSASNGFHAGEQVLLRALQNGIITVVAAGNSAADACGFWPAHSPSVITVGSTDSRDYRSSFSNYGSCVEIYAPGSAITSTLPGNKAGKMSGTSMACPVVSGAIALYLETHPSAQYQEVKQALFKNSVGQKNVKPSRRMLLVHVNERNKWQQLNVPAGSQEDSRMAEDVHVNSLYNPEHFASTSYILSIAAACSSGIAVYVIMRQNPLDTHAYSPQESTDVSSDAAL